MTIAYTDTSIAFDCALCGIQNHLVKRSPDVELSGTFCQLCDEQYWTRWDGTLHRGKIPAKKEREQ